MGEPEVKRVAALLRVSTERVEQSESPEAQLLYIREEIVRHGQGSEVWLDSHLVYEDELTGAMVLDRPSVKRLLADAKQKRFDIIVMKSIQRLGRDTLGLLHLKRLLDDLNIELVALQDGYRSRRDPELIFLVHADRAQAGREDISRNVRNAMRQRAKQGRWMAGNYPFGYRRKNRHELEPHPDTAPIIHEIFRLRRLGWGANRIAAHLNQSKVPAPAWWNARERIGKLEALAKTDDRYQESLNSCRQTVDRRPAWTTRALRVIFANTAYYGELQYYRKFWRVKLGGHKVLESRSPDEWIVVPCPALMSREEWQEAQDVLRQKTRNHDRDRPDAHVYLLSGMLFCGRCGSRMNGGGGKVGKYGWYGYYHCQARRDQRTCDLTAPRAEHFEQVLLDKLSESLQQVPEQTIDGEGHSQAARVRLQQLKEEMDDLADQKRYYRNEHRRNRVTDAELDAELARLAQEEQALKLEMERARVQAELPDLLLREGARRRELADQIARWKTDPDSIDRRQLRTLVQAAVERIDYRGMDEFDLYLRLSNA